MNNSLLELKNITQVFQNRAVLNNLSLHIQDSNKIIALFAPSGTGKTTLLHIAGLMARPTSGSIYYFGKPVTSESQRVQLRLFNIGFVFQQHHLMAELNAIENVMLPLMLQKKDPSKVKEKAENLLQTLGVYDSRHQFPSTLSGGENQRIAIARSIITGAKIIFADEPTGNLDEKNSNEVFLLMKQTLKTYQASSLLITHNKKLAKQCDYILTLKEGKILPLEL